MGRYTVSSISLAPLPGVHGGTGRHTATRLLVDPSSVPPSLPPPSLGLLRFSQGTAAVTTMLFQLNDASSVAAVVPNWFGVAFPDGVSDFTRANIFFHPQPGQDHYNDSDYPTKAGRWPRLFYYMERLGYQLDASRRNQIVIMPFLTQSAAAISGQFANTGILPPNWSDIVTGILTAVRSAQGADDGSPLVISQIVVSSFSNGIVYSDAFRKRATAPQLAEIWDFDGLFSQSSSLSQKLHGTTNPIPVQYDQVVKSDVQQFHVPVGRWGNYNPAPKNGGQVHPLIRDTMFLHACSVSTVGSLIDGGTPGAPIGAPSSSPGTPSAQPGPPAGPPVLQPGPPVPQPGPPVAPPGTHAAPPGTHVGPPIRPPVAPPATPPGTHVGPPISPPGTHVTPPTPVAPRGSPIPAPSAPAVPRSTPNVPQTAPGLGPSTPTAPVPGPGVTPVAPGVPQAAPTVPQAGPSAVPSIPGPTPSSAPPAPSVPQQPPIPSGPAVPLAPGAVPQFAPTSAPFTVPGAPPAYPGIPSVIPGMPGIPPTAPPTPGAPAMMPCPPMPGVPPTPGIASEASQVSGECCCCTAIVGIVATVASTATAAITAVTAMAATFTSETKPRVVSKGSKP